MIRAGLQHRVRTLAFVAAQQGIALQTLLNSGQHQEEGLPAPLNTGRTLLYDGAGRGVPDRAPRPRAAHDGRRR